MKKIFVSMGLAAAGVASVHAAYAPDSTDNSKVWSLSATLRGFYDDNIIARPHKQGSMGFEVSPSFGLNMPLQQTEIGLRYTYGLYFYQKREQDGQNPVDQTHQLDLWLDHAFTPRWETRVEDTVTVAQNPALTAVGTATARIEGNYLANTLNASLHTDWTQEFSTVLHYQNSFYDYENSGGNAVNPSYAGLLNRVEQTIGLDFERIVSQTTTVLVGYKFGLVNFIGNEPIEQSKVAPFPIYRSDSRDNLSHYGYVGVRHKFLENLTGSAKVGVQYTEYYNDPSAQSSLGPYADASLIYTYASGSYAQLGLTQMRNATDQIGVNQQGQITQDQESTVIYGSINHPLTPKLMSSLVGHFQYSTYNGGACNSQSAEFYNLGLNLSYAFTRHFSSDVGYNFDFYTTAVPGQDYTRNRIYLGVIVSY
jgi:hypothetical protein